MNQVMQWMTHDTTRYGYLLEHKEEWRYSLIRFAFMLFMGLIGVLLAVIKRSSLPVCIVLPMAAISCPGCGSGFDTISAADRSVMPSFFGLTRYMH